MNPLQQSQHLMRKQQRLIGYKQNKPLYSQQFEQEFQYQNKQQKQNDLPIKFNYQRVSMDKLEEIKKLLKQQQKIDLTKIDLPEYQSRNDYYQEKIMKQRENKYKDKQVQSRYFKKNCEHSSTLFTDSLKTESQSKLVNSQDKLVQSDIINEKNKDINSKLQRKQFVDKQQIDDSIFSSFDEK